jgi:predicted ribosomally synthesized peptide with nif11-like leader
MSQAIDFIKRLEDTEFSELLQRYYITATIKFAAEHGYSFTEADYIDAISSGGVESLELNDDALEKIAGGVLSFDGLKDKMKFTTMAVGEEGGGGISRLGW